MATEANISGDVSGVHVLHDAGVSTDDTEFIPNRIFINNLDSYHGRHLSHILSDKLYGGNKNEQEIGEELDEEEEASIVILGPPEEKMKYEIIGTAKKPSFKENEDILFIVNGADKVHLANEIFKCGFVVYDITLDSEEIDKARAALLAIDKTLTELEETYPKKYETSNELRVFVLLSTIMTWAKTKPLDPEDPDIAFTEADFRKRKPHPNYKEHIDLEKEVVQIGKKHQNKLRTIVIGCGVTYGAEEEHLHFLFKLAWSNEPKLPIIQPGTNVIPLINIKDLATVLYGLLEETPRKKQYILAVEQTPSTQKQIVKAISKTLGNGKTQMIVEDTSFLFEDMNQNVYERLKINLKMEPTYIVNELDLQWQSDLNFYENINKIVQEYKESRKLFPIRIFVHGPPAVGKTTLAKKLIEYYDLHYISVSTLIKETADTIAENMIYISAQIKQNEGLPAIAKNEDDEGDDEEEENLEEKLTELKEKFNEIQSILDENGDKNIPDTFIIQLIKEKLGSNPCQNQGYILDGYPQTAKQTKEIFDITPEDEIPGEGEEEAEEEEDDANVAKPTKITPEYVIALEATDEFLYKRVMTMPEIAIEGTQYNEEDMVRNVVQFRENNTEVNTLLNVFDEIEIHPIVIKTETDDMDSLLELIISKIGSPRGYPPSERELELRRWNKEVETRLAQETEKREKSEMEQKAREIQAKNMNKWLETMHTLMEDEETLLIAETKPLREYLINFVFPTLTRGLVEAARIKPEDPIDFLAEFLFRENPEGRMFDPSFTASSDDLFRTIKEFEEQLGL